MRISYRTAAAAAILAAGSALASMNAQASLLFQGVTFTSSVVSNVLTIEIDAAGRTGNWFTDNYIGAIEVGDLGISTSATVAIGGLGSGWTQGGELNGSPTSNACAGGASVGHYCFAGTPVALGDNMMFTFTASEAITGTAPMLKVAFYEGTDTSGGPVGDLLSQNIPIGTTPVPEPETYAMLLAGLGLLGFMSRRAKMH